MSRVGARVDVRPYDDADEAAVLDLLNASLGGGPAGSRPAEFFRWKHLENPFGRSFMLVAETDGRIVGLRAFMRWEFMARDRRFRAVRAVDTATHPDHQGRGIFSKLTLEALDALRDQADFVFNTPNEQSLPGYLKMGWRVVGRVPIRVRVRRPVRFATHARSWRTEDLAGDVPVVRAPLAADLLDERIDGLLVSRERPRGIATPRDGAYLRWRYGAAPLLDYRAVATGGGGHVDGLAIFRVRPRGALVEATVAETIVRGGDRRAAGRAPSERGSDDAARSRRVQLPAGFVSVARPPGGGLRPRARWHDVGGQPARARPGSRSARPAVVGAVPGRPGGLLMQVSRRDGRRIRPAERRGVARARC